LNNEEAASQGRSFDSAAAAATAQTRPRSRALTITAGEEKEALTEGQKRCWPILWIWSNDWSNDEQWDNLTC